MKKQIISILLLLSIAAFLCACDFVADAQVTTESGKETGGEPQKEDYPLKYSEYVEKYSDEYGVDKALIYAVIKTESNFRPEAVSSVGAMGLMQMMPATFKDMQKRLSEEHETDKLLDPEISIKYGTYYLKYLYNYFDDWDLVIPAYNAGMGNVSKWLKNDEYSKNGKLVKIPFSETERYVKKIDTALKEYKNLLSEV